MHELVMVDFPLEEWMLFAYWLINHPEELNQLREVCSDNGSSFEYLARINDVTIHFVDGLNGNDSFKIN